MRLECRRDARQCFTAATKTSSCADATAKNRITSASRGQDEVFRLVSPRLNNYETGY
jgi:hypothetical protein